jgi:hypothetical protein
MRIDIVPFRQIVDRCIPENLDTARSATADGNLPSDGRLVTRCCLSRLPKAAVEIATSGRSLTPKAVEMEPSSRRIKRGDRPGGANAIVLQYPEDAENGFGEVPAAWRLVRHQGWLAL